MNLENIIFIAKLKIIQIANNILQNFSIILKNGFNQTDFHMTYWV